MPISVRGTPQAKAQRPSGNHERLGALVVTPPSEPRPHTARPVYTHGEAIRAAASNTDMGACPHSNLAPCSSKGYLAPDARVPSQPLLRRERGRPAQKQQFTDGCEATWLHILYRHPRDATAVVRPSSAVRVLLGKATCIRHLSAAYVPTFVYAGRSFSLLSRRSGRLYVHPTARARPESAALPVKHPSFT